MGLGQPGDVVHDGRQLVVLRGVDPGHAGRLQARPVGVGDDPADDDGYRRPRRRAGPGSSPAPGPDGCPRGSTGRPRRRPRPGRPPRSGRARGGCPGTRPPCRRRGPRPRSARRRWSGRRGPACRRGDESGLRSRPRSPAHARGPAASRGPAARAPLRHRSARGTRRTRRAVPAPIRRRCRPHARTRWSRRRGSRSMRRRRADARAQRRPRPDRAPRATP